MADGDDLYTALGAVTPPYDVELVRGAEERTVTIGAKEQTARRGGRRGDA